MNKPTAPESPTTVVAICGSLREGSYTRMAAEVALSGAREVGAQAHLIDLRAYDLPLCDGKEDESNYPEDVFKLRREVAQAQGIILATPEYHGYFSGVLKNALDMMGFSEVEGKMIGLMGVSGGAMGGLNALSGLRTIGRSMHAWVIPEQVAIPEAWKVFDEEGRVASEALEDRMMELGRQVARFAYLHSSRKARDFIQAWEGAPANPGGESPS